MKQLIIVATMMLVSVSAVILPASVNASQQDFCRGIGGSGSSRCDECSGVDSNDAPLSFSSLVNRIVSTLLFIVGAVAVIMIIVGGIRYVASQGDAAQVKSARNMILYAVAGLVIAFSAYGIVWLIQAAL